MKAIVVDDEPLALRKTVSEVESLSEMSAVEGFTNPYDALSWLEENPVDIAFLDVEMYGMNGIELARACKSLLSNLYIIFITGYSEYAVDAFRVRASGYLLKPTTAEDIRAEIEHLSLPTEDKKGLRVHTFGNFEVFVDNVPVSFSRARSKELLAYLVDRKGAGVTSAEVAAILWEDRPYDRGLQNQTQMIISDMMKSLRVAGAENMIIKRRNHLAVDTTTFSCDYYQFLKGNVEAINSFTGEYMSNYSWAEFTTGFLDRNGG